MTVFVYQLLLSLTHRFAPTCNYRNVTIVTNAIGVTAVVTLVMVDHDIL